MFVFAAFLTLAVSVVSGCDYPRSGYVYNVIIDDGISNTKEYLSVSSDGATVDLWYNDDNSGRQQWVLEDRGSYWYFDIEGGVSTDRDTLSVTSDGTKVDLWTHDDVSGRQRWIITDAAGSDDAYCNVQVYGGISNARYLLSTTSDGSKVDLWTTDDASGRQRWRFVELRKAETAPFEKYAPDWLNERYTFVFESWWTPVVSFVLALVLAYNAVIVCCLCSRKTPYQAVKVFDRDTDVECL